MAESILTAARFTDEEAARQHLESIRWPSGPVCPHCGGTERNSALQGQSHRAGLYFCGDCRSQFTVTVGTVFERSKIPLHKWVLATHLLCSSKKGMSSHQLHRTIGVTYKTAWFMSHRIREAMNGNGGGLLGGGGGTVEADETFFGTKTGEKKRRGYAHKNAVFALVERGGQVRSFHVADVKAKTLNAVMREQIAKDANIMTDEALQYVKVGREFASHNRLNHLAGEYVRGKAHTNTVEGLFSIFKRGMIGTYHKCGEQHLQRYATEFDFRYNNRTALGVDDVQCTNKALKGISGKRLTYRRTDA